MRFHPRIRFFALGAGLAALAACSASDAPPTEDMVPEAPATAPVEAAPSLAVAQALELRNAREPVPNLITAGQPSQEQFDALVEAGYGTFISLRGSDEDGAGWEEARTQEGPTAFTRLPIVGEEGLSRTHVEELDRLLNEAEGAPTVLYCGSSNRVGALMALRAFWLGGASAEEAMALGGAAGMTRLEPTVAGLIAGEG